MILKRVRFQPFKILDILKYSVKEFLCVYKEVDVGFVEHAMSSVTYSVNFAGILCK